MVAYNITRRECEAADWTEYIDHLLRLYIELRLRYRAMQKFEIYAEKSKFSRIHQKETV